LRDDQQGQLAGLIFRIVLKPPPQRARRRSPPRAQDRVVIDPIAVVDQHLLDAAVQTGEDVLPHHRLERPAGLHLEAGWPEEQNTQQDDRHGQHRQCLGQGPRLHHPLRLAQRLPHGHQEEVLMFPGIGQRRTAVGADEFDPLLHALRDPVVLDPLDDQGPHDRFGLSGMLLVCLRIVTGHRRPQQRQHAHRLRLRLVDVLLDYVLDLRGHLPGITGVPDRLSRGHHHLGQLPEQPDGVGAFLEHVLAADGLDRTLTSFGHRQAHPIALDQPAAFVGDGVGRLADVQAGVHGPGKLLQPRPEGLAIGQAPQLPRPKIIAGQFAHLQGKPQISPLGLRGGVGPLEDLQHADRLQVRPQRGQHQQVVGRIDRRLVGCRSADGRRPGCGGGVFAGGARGPIVRWGQ